MLVIIICIIIAVIVCILALKCNDASSCVALFFLGLIIGVCGIGIGVFGATEYGEWNLIKETELVSLSNSTTSEGKSSIIYVSISGENTYTYRYEVDSELGTNTSKEYVVETLSSGVIESEDANCEVAVLKEYKRKSKATIWTLGLFNTETQYVFYVPEGTIQKEMQLH